MGRPANTGLQDTKWKNYNKKTRELTNYVRSILSSWHYAKYDDESETYTQNCMHTINARHFILNEPFM